MARTNIDIDESLIRKARKLTRLKTKRQIVDKALELLVRSERRVAQPSKSDCGLGINLEGAPSKPVLLGRGFSSTSQQCRHQRAYS